MQRHWVHRTVRLVKHQALAEAVRLDGRAEDRVPLPHRLEEPGLSRGARLIGLLDYPDPESRATLKLFPISTSEVDNDVTLDRFQPVKVTLA